MKISKYLPNSDTQQQFQGNASKLITNLEVLCQELFHNIWS
jgi:hypothetical protein